MSGAIKRISFGYQTGLTLYCIARRNVDGYLLNNATGSFASAPANPYVSLTEDAVIKGLYELLESRSVWNDGNYEVIIYAQVGGSPAPVNDTLVGTSELIISSDATNNSDFNALQKTSLNAATPSVTVSDKTGFAISGTKTTLDALNDITAASIWAVGTRTLSSFGTLVSDIAAAVWAAATRTLSAFGFTVNINAPADMALNSTVAKDATVMKTAGYTAPSTPDAIAIAVEQHIINESDGEQVLKAITDKIAAVDPSLSDLTLSAIASAVRTELTTELGRIDAAISSRLAASGYTAPPAASAIRTEMDTNSTKLAHLDADISTRTKPADAQTITPPADMALNSTVAKDTPVMKAANYTAPDNSDIADIKAKTDNLPASPAAVGSAMILTSDYDAAKTAAAPGVKMDLINSPNPSAVAVIQSGLAEDATVAKPGAKMDLIDAPNATAIIAIQNGLARTGAIVYPVMHGRVFNATPFQNQEVIIVQGDTPRLPFDFGGNYEGWTATFAAKVHLDDTTYIINPTEATWLDASLGQGYIDLTTDDTAAPGKYYAEILLEKDSQRLTAMRFSLKIINGIIT